MSIQIQAGDHCLFRTATFPTATTMPVIGSDRTIMFRCRCEPTGVYALFYAYAYTTDPEPSSGSTFGTDYEDVWLNAVDDFGFHSGPVLYFGAGVGATFGNLNGASPITGADIHIAAVIQANVRTMYVNGVQFGDRHYYDGGVGDGDGNSVTFDTHGAMQNVEMLGGDTFSETPITVWDYRQWSVALTPVEIAAEIASTSTVARSADLFAFTPLTSQSDLLDVSGNNRHWALHPPAPIVDTGSTTPPTYHPADCCTEGGSVGATPEEDTTTLAGWIPSCVGGGEVPSAADITNSEAWDPQ